MAGTPEDPMTQVESAPSQRRKINWYKWGTGVGVPIVVALIGLLKFGGGGGQQSTTNNFTTITDVTVIENQYQQITGQPLTDPALKQQLQAAVNLVKAGQFDASRKIFEQVAAQVPVPAVYTNIGALAAEGGDVATARHNYQQALAKDPDYKPAKNNLDALVRLETPRAVETRGQEQEPNNDFDHVNVIPPGTKISAAISAAGDNDFYRVTTPKGPRDIFQALVENGSTTLHPTLNVTDAVHHNLCANESDEPLARMECNFSGESETTFFIAVGARYNNPGAYTISVTGLKKFDRYEPNDDYMKATPLSLGARLEANIMDAMDADFFVVTSNGAGQLTAHLENDSTTLHPTLTVLDGNNHEIKSLDSDEAVSTMDIPFMTAAQSKYYVRVGARFNNVGAYKISVK